MDTTVHLAAYMDGPEPPPPGYASDPRLTTVTDWLKDIIQGKAPEGRVEQFNIGLYTSEKDGQVDYILTLEEFRNDTIKGLPDIRLAVLPELKAYVQSDAFRTSSLSKAQLITTDFSGPLQK